LQPESVTIPGIPEMQIEEPLPFSSGVVNFEYLLGDFAFMGSGCFENVFLDRYKMGYRKGYQTRLIIQE
jgi:hypothetical protein